ncbi:hypothetical protein BX661DRAFT_176453 [Kickxella alabastrina]|uniref:uncharacterized protein n=1 Tax=Kickxella alabastrina TaxID=61397 RepID=UPI00221E704C|nr:uncharacterized protein BX661DRAFT_176453 [Kickxella alabastrina]KAI7834000.1 hypothetical protein BX661DRAFT_176453 [Kickxella alabastrina]
MCLSLNDSVFSVSGSHVSVSSVSDSHESRSPSSVSEEMSVAVGVSLVCPFMALLSVVKAAFSNLVPFLSLRTLTSRSKFAARLWMNSTISSDFIVARSKPGERLFGSLLLITAPAPSGIILSLILLDAEDKELDEEIAI